MIMMVVIIVVASFPLVFGKVWMTIVDDDDDRQDDLELLRLLDQLGHLLLGLCSSHLENETWIALGNDQVYIWKCAFCLL